MVETLKNIYYKYQLIVNATTVRASESGFHEIYISHLAEVREAKRSISGTPKCLLILSKAAILKFH